MRKILCSFTLVLACFSESDTSGSDAPAETTGSPCTPGSESCACALGGECDTGLVCADAQCVLPAATTTVADSSDATTESTGNESSGATSMSTSTSTSDATSSSEVGSSDTSSAGSVCDGSCLECHACAVAGPCAAEYEACEEGACGNTPFCMMSCAQQLYSCAQCCDEATLALAVDLVECFAEQCGVDCSFSC